MVHVAGLWICSWRTSQAMIHWAKLGEHAACGRRILPTISMRKRAPMKGCALLLWLTGWRAFSDEFDQGSPCMSCSSKDQSDLHVEEGLWKQQDERESQQAPSQHEVQPELIHPDCGS
jgi:hypothetical protein